MLLPVNLELVASDIANDAFVLDRRSTPEVLEPLVLGKASASLCVANIAPLLSTVFAFSSLKWTESVPRNL